MPTCCLRGGCLTGRTTPAWNCTACWLPGEIRRKPRIPGLRLQGQAGARTTSTRPTWRPSCSPSPAKAALRVYNLGGGPRKIPAPSWKHSNWPPPPPDALPVMFTWIRTGSAIISATTATCAKMRRHYPDWSVAIPTRIIDEIVAAWRHLPRHENYDYRHLRLCRQRLARILRNCCPTWR